MPDSVIPACSEYWTVSRVAAAHNFPGKGTISNSGLLTSELKCYHESLPIPLNLRHSLEVDLWFWVVSLESPWPES